MSESHPTDAYQQWLFFVGFETAFAPYEETLMETVLIIAGLAWAVAAVDLLFAFNRETPRDSDVTF